MSSLKAITDEEYDEIITDESLSELYNYYTADVDLSDNEKKIDDLIGSSQAAESKKPVAKKTATKTVTTVKKTPAKKTTTTKKTTAKKTATKTAAKKTATRAVGNAVGSAATVVGREAGKGLLKLFKRK